MIRNASVFRGWETSNRIMARSKPEFCGYVIAAVAVLSAGFSIYSATQGGGPGLQKPPPPPNSTTYGDDGEVLSRQVFDSARNEWITYGANSEPQKPKWVKAPGAKPDPSKYSNPDRYNKKLSKWETDNDAYQQYQKDLADFPQRHEQWQKDHAQRLADKETLARIKSDTLKNLDQTPEDRKAAYEKYAQDFAAAAHSTADPQFEKMSRNEEERANTTGMMGSRSYVDTKAELADVKTKQDTDISTQAAMAKEQLASNDRNYWMGLLDQIDSGQRADTLASIQRNKTAADMTNQNYAGTLGYYSTINNNRMAQWEAERQKSAAYSQAGSGMANGLLYLYGGMGSGGGGGKGGSSTFNYSPTKTNYGSFSLFG